MSRRRIAQGSTPERKNIAIAKCCSSPRQQETTYQRRDVLKGKRTPKIYQSKGQIIEVSSDLNPCFFCCISPKENTTKTKMFETTIHLKTLLKNQENHELLVNALKKLKTISELEDDWNDNGAKHFENSLLLRCFLILATLEKFPPEIFPVADNSIQMEYDGDDGSYLQFRIYDDKIRMFRILSNGQKSTEMVDKKDIPREVKYFYEVSRQQ